jgi:hypothetical protein
MWVDGQRHAPAALTQERTGTHCTGDWGGGPRAGLDGCGKFRPQRDSIPGPSSPKRGAVLTTPQLSEICNGKQICFLVGIKYCKYYN